MHDRVDAGGAVIGHLVVAVVRIKPYDFSAARREGVGRMGRNGGVDFAGHQHRAETAVETLLVLNAGRQFELHLLVATGLIDAGLHPFNFAQIDAGGLSQKAPRINAGGLRPFRDADRLAFEILRRRDAAIGAHVNCRMAKHPRRKNRNADKRRIAEGVIGDELAERHFGHVPLAVLDEAEEHFLDRQHEGGERDAIDAHRATHHIADVVVIGGRERQMQPRRPARFDQFRRAIGLPQLARFQLARFIDGHCVLSSGPGPGGHAPQPTRNAPPLYAAGRWFLRVPTVCDHALGCTGNTRDRT